MSDWPIIERFEHEGMRVTLSYEEYDHEFANPRDGFNLGIMLANGHRNYTLGDEPYREHVSGYDEVEKAMEHFLDRLRPSKALAAFDRWARIYFGATVVLPLYLLDHSGLAMRTGPFMEDPGGWDSGVVGVILDGPAQREEGWPTESASLTAEKVTEILRDEVKYYDAYLQGQVIEWTVEKREGGACGHPNCEEHQDWDLVDSTGGILYAVEEDLKYARSEAVSAAEHEAAKGAPAS